jgi:hypothetical protein
MSVESPNVIDVVGIERTTGRCVLTISDHLQWSQEHLVALQAKLNGYLRYIESGEVYVSYPESKAREFVIEVALLYRPDEMASAFLERVRAIIASAGVGFRYKPLPSGYATDET